MDKYKWLQHINDSGDTIGFVLEKRFTKETPEGYQGKFIAKMRLKNIRQITQVV